MIVTGEPWTWLVANIGWPVVGVLFGDLAHSRGELVERYQERAERAEAEREAIALRHTVSVIRHGPGEQGGYEVVVRLPTGPGRP